MSDDVCRYCGCAIREVKVVVGDAPGHEVMLRIGVDPDPEGRVIQRLDGSFRLLGHLHYKASRKPGYGVHGSTMSECEGSQA